MPLLIVTPLLLALIAPWLVRRAPAWAPRLFAGTLVALWIGVLSSSDSLAEHGRLVFERSWVPSLGLSFALSLDGLSQLFVLLVTGLGAAIFAYAGAYFGPRPDLGRTYSVLLLFTAAMLGLVLADDLLLLFLFWELTSVSSYLLVGHAHEKPEARLAARRALLVTGGGGLALLVGLLLLTELTGATRLSELPTDGLLAASPMGLAALGCLALGALTKSAQWPFSGWLPGAMAAPTPISAFLHSATMVKAGVYLLARLHPTFGQAPAWHVGLTALGVVTMLLGATFALFQDDLKRVLAFTTISALGTLVLLLGLGSVDALHAAMLLLLVHALYKGALFMVVGALDHETGTRSLQRLGGLRRVMPGLAAAALLAGLSMAGLPPLLGFVVKELIYEAKLGAGSFAVWVTTAGFLANAFMIAAAVLVAWRPFAGAAPASTSAPEATPTPTPTSGPKLALWGPPAVVALAGLGFGLLPDLLVADIIDAAATVARGDPTTVDLALWHGFNPVLLLSLLTVAVGLLLAATRDRIVARLGGLAELGRFGPARLIDRVIAGVPRAAAQLDRVLRPESLHGQIAVALPVIALSLLAVLGGPLLELGDELEALPSFGWPALESVLVLLTAAAGVGVVLARKRAGALVALGLVGLGVSLLFLVHGGPDLAMTQLAVEALAVLLLVLVVARLPAPTERRQGAGLGALALALLVGGGVAAATVLAGLHGADTSLADTLTAQSVPEGKGRNVVNVILVDFRSLDTLGEIVVLGTAALGVGALLRRRKKEATT